MTGKLPGERLFSTPTRADNRRNIPPTLPSGTLGMFHDHGNQGVFRTVSARIQRCPFAGPQTRWAAFCHTAPSRNSAKHPSRSTEGRYRSIAGASWSRLVPGLGFSPRVSGAFAGWDLDFLQNGPVAVSWPATTCVPADGRG